MNKPQRRKHPDECPTCNGFGQTKETATIVRNVNDRLVTTQMGSGCPNCLGTGRIKRGGA